MEDLTLVIMAAGMGSRFGGIKQIEPVGPNKEILSEYNIYDAINAGFNKIVFIIRKEHLDIFEKEICSKYSDKIRIEYAFQELDSIPTKGVIPRKRVKMLGTTHAVLCAKDKIKGNFIVINADDYYGKSSFIKAANFFKNNCDEKTYLTVNYPFIKTASLNGAVKRGVCELEDGYVKDVIESEIRLEDKHWIAKPLAGEKEFIIDENNPVSMNFFGFRENVFKDMQKYFDDYSEKIEEKNECLLPMFLKEEINNKKIKLLSTLSDSRWMGITYHEDLEYLIKEINKMIEKGEYPYDLWGRKSKGKN